MTGFNVNCSECAYCYENTDYIEDDYGIPVYPYFCSITGMEVDVINNTDCCDYEPKRADN